MNRRLMSGIVLMGVLAAAAQAATIWVDAIQEGINAAANADGTLLADRTNTGIGNKDLRNARKAITVRSESVRINLTINHECDGRALWEPIGLLYAPTENDNPTFRDALEAILGVDVDYFDARVATPTLGELMQYQTVLTWVNWRTLVTILVECNSGRSCWASLLPRAGLRQVGRCEGREILQLDVGNEE